MKINTLIIFCLAMMAFLPHSLAFAWQDDVDAVARDVSKTYEVYPHMPYSDFISTWSDVPGWTCLSRGDDWGGGLKQAIFRKNETGNDSVIEEFRVLYNKDQVLMTELCFKSDDKKVLNRIFNYATVRINDLTKQHKQRKYNNYNHRLADDIWWGTPDKLGEITSIGIALINDKKNPYVQYLEIYKNKDLGAD